MTAEHFREPFKKRGPFIGMWIKGEYHPLGDPDDSPIDRVLGVRIEEEEETNDDEL